MMTYAEQAADAAHYEIMADHDRWDGYGDVDLCAAAEVADMADEAEAEDQRDEAIGAVIIWGARSEADAIADAWVARVDPCPF